MFDIIGKRNWFFAFSLAITIPGLIFILLTILTGGRMGLQFSIDDPAAAAGIAVDAQDRVYLLTRNVDNPVVVLERDGTFLRTFGQGVFTPRAHAIRIGPDGFAYGADDGAHIITKWTLQGELVMTIGTPGQASGRFSGLPFNRPTDVAWDNDGNIFVAEWVNTGRITKLRKVG